MMTGSLTNFKVTMKHRNRLFGKALPIRSVFIAATISFAASSPAVFGQSIEVTVPQDDQRVAEGRDYATWQLGNRWDMDCPDWNGVSGFPGDPVWDGRFTCDLIVSRNRCVTDESFSGGSYFATSTSTCNNAGNADPNLILVSPGPVAGVGLSNGRNFPIDTSVYRYVTVKVRTLNTSSNQGSMVFFQTSGDANDPFGRTDFKTIRPDGWQFVSFDLLEDVPPASQLTWNGQDEVIGLRFDPVPNNGIDFEIDWMRLSADPAVFGTPETSMTVEWEATGLPNDSVVSISAVDDDAELILVEGIPADNGTASVDLARLGPGAYTIRVAADGASGLSDGRFLVNSAPEFHLTEPDLEGDESRDYALDVFGNAWGPMDSGDILIGNTAQTNLENIDFTGGELVADATDGGVSPGDPRMTFATPNVIDTSIYRMLTYEYQLEILPDQIGSVARIHWGTSAGVDPTPDTVTDDIRVRQGFNTYVLGDMREVPDKDGIIGVWNGDLTVLRFDPHEVDDTREIVFRSLRLRPLDTADPAFTIQWEAADQDASDPMVLSLYRDSDNNPFNGNEVLLVEGIDANTASEFVWNATGVPDGEYRILADVSDGFNTLSRYATGPVNVVADAELVFADGFE
jgi:hypothetical protein